MLELSQDGKLAGRSVASKTGEHIELHAIKAGPGKIQCASAAQLIIDSFHPDYVMDVGSAGALSEELKINDIISVKHAFEYDVCDLGQFSRLASDLTTRTVMAELLSHNPEIMEEFSDWVKSNTSARLVAGNLASGEKNITGGKLKKDLCDRLGAIACNWETSAVLKTSQLNRVQAFSFRIITDKADKDMAESIRKNWEGALRILYAVLNEFIFHGWLHRISRALRKQPG
jgi:adenosylhomocysteine nucleosidase